MAVLPPHTSTSQRYLSRGHLHFLCRSHFVIKQHFDHKNRENFILGIKSASCQISAHLYASSVSVVSGSIV